MPVQWFGRVTSATLLKHPDVTIHVAVKHFADKGCSRDYIHYIVTTTLGDKAFRKAVRAACNVTAKMDIAWAPFDELRDWAKYLVNHCGAEVLVADDDYKESLDRAKAEVAALMEAEAKRKAEEAARLEQVNAEMEREFQDEWGFPMSEVPPLLYKYTSIIDRLEYVTKFWAKADKTLSWEQYTAKVMHWLTEMPDYRYVYSEYRLRGDVKFLYYKFFRGDQSAVTRMFGH